jgi:hypothetical protein
MTKRARYTWLIGFAVVGTVFALGAWHQSPGEDTDNQGGFVLVLLAFVVLLLIYVPLTLRMIGGMFRRRPDVASPPTDDA